MWRNLLHYKEPFEQWKVGSSWNHRYHRCRNRWMYYMCFSIWIFCISIWILPHFCLRICDVLEVLWNCVQKGLNKGLSEDFYCHVGSDLMFTQTQLPFSFIQILFTVSICHIPRINPSHRSAPIQNRDPSWVILTFRIEKLKSLNVNANVHLLLGQFNAIPSGEFWQHEQNPNQNSLGLWLHSFTDTPKGCRVWIGCAYHTICSGTCKCQGLRCLPTGSSSPRES